MNRLWGATHFCQNDFYSLHLGRVQVVVVSLSPPEKGLLTGRSSFKMGGAYLRRLILGENYHRGQQILEEGQYFFDLEAEYSFLLQLDGQLVQLAGKYYQYHLCTCMEEIEALHEAFNPVDPIPIAVMLSIEGGHAFNAGWEPGKMRSHPAEVLMNVYRVKNWPHSPLYVTLAHQFYNELCGHTAGLKAPLKWLIRQRTGERTGFTVLGWEVVHALLDQRYGRRIFIDLQHMSLKAREEYYLWLELEYPDESIPIIVSHGAVNGWKSPEQRWIELPNSVGMFPNSELNFFDSELIKIAESNGIFGIQLDEYQIAHKRQRRMARMEFSLKGTGFLHAKFFWEQIRHIAEVLDRAGLPAWHIQVIGSNHDGMNYPLSGFWTAAQFPQLSEYLFHYAEAYLQHAGKQLYLRENREISATEIIQRVAHQNAWEFLQRNYSQTSTS